MVLCIVKTSKFKPLFILTLAALVSSCAQTIPQQSSTAERELITELAKDETPEPATLSAEQLLAQAATYQGEAQQIRLLKAAEAALLEQNSALALAITDTLRQSDSALIRQRNQVLLLQAYLQHDELALAEQLIEQTNRAQLAPSDQAAFLWSSAKLYQQQQRAYAAARSLLQLDEMLGNNPTLLNSYAELHEQLWPQLSALSHSELTNLQVGAGQRARGWLNLLEVVRNKLGNPEQLNNALTEWQQRYPQLPSLSQLPKALQQQLALTPYQPKRIAVLLPLSGQFQQHAKAIQYGLLAATSADNSLPRELLFIDSQQSVADIQQQLAAKQIDFVIGPLLKDQVEQVSKQADWTYPTLFLNSRDSQLPAQPDRFYFALNLEDEAAQMVQLFAQKNYKRPVIISSRNAISQRMQQHFTRQWQALGHEAPESYQFEAKAELEALITRLLETDSSRERIRLISGLIPGSVESEAHSRLDIDAIYLLADPVQTRMFKPFVDVSVMQTAPKLPIYASSRSYSAGGDANDLRDLNGLTFTETPWLLNEQHSQKVRQQYLELFSEQDETLQRLFAMGYDAYHIIGSLKQQQQLPSLSHPGFTGRLTVNADGSISRQLSWGSYRSNRLVAVQEP
ncbi:penicillin-binding protein activator [Alishewanella sp. SMS8]|uniref:penicillin-binding protein activator n=1 Tax=Alishewanella sp. SMS8 TaxID=2994676 RepID=UPI002742653F|nr:penicillin-binding protein activator [Alishewanella sp. SMS8]MDP5036459.1 penicillin-binding protein activator [Alishewanella sp.]MDP5458941.1 penicillin-binding protein activator [Alishewanella sp. SMS8]